MASGILLFNKKFKDSRLRIFVDDKSGKSTVFWEKAEKDENGEFIFSSHDLWVFQPQTEEYIDYFAIQSPRTNEYLGMDKHNNPVLSTKISKSYIWQIVPVTAKRNGIINLAQNKALMAKSDRVVSGTKWKTEDKQTWKFVFYNKKLGGLGLFNLEDILSHQSDIGNRVFPSFKGKQLAAYNEITALLEADLRTEIAQITTSDFVGVKELIRSGQTDVAWDEDSKAVLHTTFTWIKMRDDVDTYFNAMENFIQNTFITNSNLVDMVGEYLKIDDSKSKFSVDDLLTEILVAGMFGLGTRAIVSNFFIGFAMDTVKFAIFYAKDKIQDYVDYSGSINLSLGEIKAQLIDTFTQTISYLEDTRNSILKDYGALVATSKVAIPSSTMHLRKTLAASYERSLWRQLLPVVGAVKIKEKSVYTQDLEKEFQNGKPSILNVLLKSDNSDKSLALYSLYCNGSKVNGRVMERMLSSAISRAEIFYRILNEEITYKKVTAIKFKNPY
ncbi:MAG: hypothetical protein AB8G15_20085 [Saprospiraceae bacterium]